MRWVPLSSARLIISPTTAYVFMTVRSPSRVVRRVVPPALTVEVDDDRGVIRGALALARLAVHHRILDGAGQIGRGVDQIDAHPHVFVEHSRTVIPIGERTIPFQGTGGDVGEAETSDLFQRLTL